MAAPASLPIARAQRRVVLPANKGVYLDRPSIAIPEGGMSDCLNVRVKDGRTVSGQMGWEKFFSTSSFVLNGMVLMIDQFFLRAGSQILIFATQDDLYRYDETGGDALYITPIYTTGTVSINNGSPTVTGVGTAWDTVDSTGRKNALAGDEIAFETATENDPTATWYTIQSVDSDTQLTLTANYSGSNLSGVVYTLRQKFTGDDLDLWAAATFWNAQPSGDDLWFAVNGNEWVKWNGSGNQVTRFDPGFKARTLAVHKNMLLAGLVQISGTFYPSTFKSSDITEPEDWAGGAQLASSDGIDDLLALTPLGDLMVAYHERSINLLQFVGPPLFWVIRTAVSGIGPISQRSIMDFGDFHEFLGADGGYRFDGVGIEEVGSQVFREVLRKLSPNRKIRALTHIDEENGDVHWIIPVTTDAGSGPEIAYSEHYLENVGRAPIPMTIRELPATATGFFERASQVRWNELTLSWANYNFRWNDRFFDASFPYNLFGDENGRVYIFGTTEDQDGSNIVSFARFGRFAVGDGRRKGIIKRIEPFAQRRETASYSLGVIVHMADQLEGPTTQQPQQLYDLTHAGRRFVSPRRSGRFAEIEFAQTGQNRPWEISGYAVETMECGER